MPRPTPRAPATMKPCVRARGTAPPRADPRAPARLPDTEHAAPGRRPEADPQPAPRAAHLHARHARAAPRTPPALRAGPPRRGQHARRERLAQHPPLAVGGRRRPSSASTVGATSTFWAWPGLRSVSSNRGADDAAERLLAHQVAAGDDRERVVARQRPAVVARQRVHRVRPRGALSARHEQVAGALARDPPTRVDRGQRVRRAAVGARSAAGRAPRRRAAGQRRRRASARAPLAVGAGRGPSDRPCRRTPFCTIR